MADVLHLVKDPGNQVALDVIRAQSGDASLRVSVVLMQEAAGLTLAEPRPHAVYRLADPHGDSAPSSDARTIGPSELLDLIFAADSVVTW